MQCFLNSDVGGSRAGGFRWLAQALLGSFTGTRVPGRCRRLMRGSDLAGWTPAGAAADLTELL